MKTFVITLAKHFPQTHPRKGQLTQFESSVLSGRKIHTIRANYKLWKERLDKVQNGEAILSVREWTGKPYNSPQREICQLSSKHGVGIEEMVVGRDRMEEIMTNGLLQKLDFNETLAENDGLSLVDLLDWFKGYEQGEENPLAIIHFTNFRYD